MAWGNVAANRNQRDISDYPGRPKSMWETPKPGQSEWSKRPKAADQQKDWDEAELRRPTRTERDFWGRERKFDAQGREMKDPSEKKHWWSDGLI